MKTVVLDATALDTVHRIRGIGRYVQGLLRGFEELGPGALPFDLRLLRTDPDGNDPFPTVRYRRLQRNEASKMHIENQLRLDRALPEGTALYHATGMEGVARRTPWVATCHDLIPLLLRGRYLRPWAVREILFWNNYVQVLREQANRIIAISEHTRGTLIEHFDMDERKIDVVYHGLSPYWSAPADVPTVSERIRQATAVPYILFVGGFDPRKNFPKLVQALWLIPPERRPRLLVAGGRSKSNKKDHARLPRIGQMDVHFLEYISDDDLRWLYSQALCLAFPSHEEGWGFPIVEAMAAGTPVVCADHGSMREAAGGAAITTNVNRVEELSHALSIPIESSSIRDERVAAGRERVQSLTWKACAQSVSDVYENALS